MDWKWRMGYIDWRWTLWKVKIEDGKGGNKWNGSFFFPNFLTERKCSMEDSAK